MKKVLLLFALLLPGISFAQSYSIDWHKISGGSGTSANGPYIVSGTIGQPDATAQTLTGGNYSLTGGFWNLISIVPTSGAPNLAIKYSGNSVKISWPSSSMGFVLQQNPDLAGGNWATSGYTISDDGTNKSITIALPAGQLFFRLKNP